MRVSRKAVEVVAWATASIAALWVWHRRSIPREKLEIALDSQRYPVPLADGAESIPANQSGRTGQNTPRNAECKDPPNSGHKRRRRLLPWFGIATVLALLPIAISAVHIQNIPLAGVCLLVGISACAYFIRGPRRHYNWPLFITFIILFEILVLASLFLLLVEETSISDVISLLTVTVFCICGLSIIVCLGATWLRTMRFTEPLAIGTVAVAVGLLCIPGLRLASEQLTPPFFTGSVLLFATGHPNQRISLYTGVVGVQDFIGSPPVRGDELLQVNNLSKHPLRWALLVTGEARIPKYKISSPGVGHLELTASGSGLSSSSYKVAAQLFWGKLAGHRNLSLHGTSEGSFYDSTTDKAAITLPYYNEGRLSDLSSATKATIVSILKASPVYRSASDFTLRISSGPMYPLDSITAASLNPVQNPNNPGFLEWTVHTGTSISYAIEDQGAADVSSNALFVFAVLLGVAGAGVIASLQSTIRIFLEGRSGN
jgi:hypothetical protein